jgi:hypothetical protein
VEHVQPPNAHISLFFDLLAWPSAPRFLFNDSSIQAVARTTLSVALGPSISVVNILLDLSLDKIT